MQHLKNIARTEEEQTLGAQGLPQTAGLPPVMQKVEMRESPSARPTLLGKRLAREAQVDRSEQKCAESARSDSNLASSESSQRAIRASRHFDPILVTQIPQDLDFDHRGEEAFAASDGGKQLNKHLTQVI